MHPCRGNKSGTLVNALVHYSDQLSSGLGRVSPGHRAPARPRHHRRDDRHQARRRPVEDRQAVREAPDATRPTWRSCTARPNWTPTGSTPRWAFTRRSGKSTPSGRRSARKPSRIYEVLEAFRGFSLLKLHAADRPDAPDPRAPVATSSTRSWPTTCTAASSSIPGNWPTPSRRSRSRSSPAVALHAWTIEFRHPTTEQMVKFEAPLPRRHAAPPRHAPRSTASCSQP